MKRFWALICCVILCVQPVYATNPNQAEEEQKIESTKEKTDEAVVSAPSVLLMEVSTGKVIYEKDADSKRAPASVTKIMTLLLIFDALENGKITLEDSVTTSEYAASMGGSQVFLETGETQTVETLIKCISVASANDACVAMAEYISGSEEAFVKQMNVRAQELGMTNTTFKNCNGLDTEGHLTTARDIALMSRELLSKYPKIHEYCTIWQENIVHTTKKGSSEFGLTNTNKLIRHYEYTTGLKTGSTSQAKFCISATAEKNGLEMIAVIMAAETSKERNRDAVTLLNYGFGKCQKYKEEQINSTDKVKVSGGQEEQVKTAQKEAFTYIDTTGADFSQMERKVVMKEKLNAPVQQGEKAGEAVYYLNGTEIGRVEILTTEYIPKSTYQSAMQDTLEKYLL